MAGFVKQLVDACALDVLLREHPARPDRPVGIIDSGPVTPGQVFVRKTAAT